MHTETMTHEGTPQAAFHQAYRAAERELFGALGLRAREREIRIGSAATRVRVVEHGDGPPVLHLHGGGAFAALHAPLAAALPGRRHVLFDRPGFGLSDRAPPTRDFRAQSVELLTGLLDALSLPQVDLVANSIGGAMALWLALDPAGRARVRGIGLVGGIAMIGEVPTPAFFRLAATPLLGDLLLRAERPSPAQARRFFARFGHDPDAVHPALLELLLASERGPNFAPAWRDLVHATNTWRGYRPGLAVRDDELRELRCPIAFGWGQRDPMVDASIGRRVASLLGVPFTLAGVGHCPWLTDAQGVARAIEPALTPVSLP